MKTIKLSLLVALTVSALFGITSCTTTKLATQPPPQYPPEQPHKNLTNWNYSYLDYFQGPMRKKLDTVAFYVSVEITIDTSLFKAPIISVNKKDGSVVIRHIQDDIFKNVLTTTPGGLIALEKGQGGEDVMVLRYSRNDEVSYTLRFWPTSDGNAILGGDATLRFEGKDYPITVKTNGECFLMFDLSEQTEKKEHKNTAEGYRPN